MSLLHLTSIQDSSPELFKQMLAVRDLISLTGSASNIESAPDNTSQILELLNSPQNSKGDFYKYYFDLISGSDPWSDPAGNNILLLVVARSSFNKVDRDTIVAPLAKKILQDACTKLGGSSDAFKEFISFKFISSSSPQEYCYDNTPLTLAIKSGLTDIAIELVKYGANVNATSYGAIDSTKEAYGTYSPLHLALLRLPFLSDKEKEICLIKNLLEAGANIEQVDNFSRTPKDLANLHNLQAKDKKCFSFKEQHIAETCNMGGKDAKGLIKAFSFNELIHTEQFRAFYNSKPPAILLNGDETEQQMSTFKMETNTYLNSSRHTTDVSKFCAPDNRQVMYDLSLEKYERCSQNSEILEGTNFIGEDLTYSHNEFHGTPSHLAVCNMLGVAPCAGGDHCL